MHKGDARNTGSPLALCRKNQPDAREGQVVRLGVAARFVIPGKPDNAGGGKGPQVKIDVRGRIGKDRTLGNVSTPKCVRNLWRALHAKVKAGPDFRFYALYDKIYRGGILAHAFPQYR